MEQIRKYLDAENVDAQFNDRNAEYHSKDKFIVTWNENYKGIDSEFAIDKTDAFYASYSGYKAIYCTRGLFHEKQLAGYHSIERALIEVGMKLCDKNEKEAFFDKYAVKYNQRLKKERKQKRIEEAYKRFFNPEIYHYSINGWMSLAEIDEKTLGEMMDEINLEFREHTFRPKSLNGIEN